MWKSLNLVVISFEKELDVTTRRFDQYAQIVTRRNGDIMLNEQMFIVKIISTNLSRNVGL